MFDVNIHNLIHVPFIFIPLFLFQFQAILTSMSLIYYFHFILLFGGSNKFEGKCKEKKIKKEKMKKNKKID